MPRRVILQLDFDGTLTERDVNEAMFLRFLGPEWSSRIEAASHEIRRDPSSSALIETLQEATAQLRQADSELIDYASRSVRLRPGLRSLVEMAEKLSVECHVVSYGFDFYISHYLRRATVDARISVHCGETAVTPDGRRLTYRGPDGEPVTRDFKSLWTRSFRDLSDVLLYADDGGSDLAPALLADVVFACRSLLREMSAGFSGKLYPFETLDDIARELERLIEPGR
jgi:2-hydroxy-3-keto-5-methylthiopentenyl-1-phosphate phosphatase